MHQAYMMRNCTTAGGLGGGWTCCPEGSKVSSWCRQLAISRSSSEGGAFLGTATFITRPHSPLQLTHCQTTASCTYPAGPRPNAGLQIEIARLKYSRSPIDSFLSASRQVAEAVTWGHGDSSHG